jgi:hypothetical protein
MEVWNMTYTKKYLSIGLTLSGFLLSAALVTTLRAGQQEKELVFSSFDPPGSVFTVPQGINERGEISGGFIDAQGAHGFLLRHGKVTVIGAARRAPSARSL